MFICNFFSTSKYKKNKVTLKVLLTDSYTQSVK